MSVDVAASSPSSDGAFENQELSDKLDADIARVRAEIQSLTKRKHLLTSSLLSSTKIQSYLTSRNASSQTDLPTDQTPLQAQAQHNETNIHRLAYGVTSFPFTDPNPDTSDRPLIGIRFDIPSRNGKFDQAPYYIFLNRVHEDNSGTDTPMTSRQSDLKIHHHTIPALVPLQEYESRYLSQTTTLELSRRTHRGDEGYFSPSPTDDRAEDGNMDEEGRTQEVTRLARPVDIDASTDKNVNAQDLHGLVEAVRRDLMSWRLRGDAISLLAEQLGVSDVGKREESEGDTGKFSLQSVGATALDARFCRLVWQNGAVGRLRLTDDGYIDRAVVIGDTGTQARMDRLKDIERILCTGKNGQRLRVEGLIERLREVEGRMRETSTSEPVEPIQDDSMELDQTDLDRGI